jgi:hypothetical protein
MRRPILQDATAPGQDSFLDILANIVGILIILVMVVGMRVKNTPVDLDGPEKATQAALAGLERDRALAVSVRGDVVKDEVKIEALRRETLARNAERLRLATLVSAARHSIQTRRDQLDADARKEFDLRRAVSESQAELDRLRQRQAQARQADAAPKVVQSYPTPLSRPVDSHEAHFQLRGGLVVFVPLQELVAEFKADARTKAHNLLGMPELTETIGPIGGFRLKYTLQRKTVALELDRRTGAVGTYATLKYLTLIPTRSRMGETLQEALADGSDFRRALGRFRPGRSTVTIWTYPDSFAQFRKLKQELYAMGYETAARPLPFGIPISAAPQGSKSAAE